MALDLFFEKIMHEDGFAEKVFNATTIEEVQEITKGYGVELTGKQVLEAKEIIEDAIDKSLRGELSDEDLDNVAGGNNLYPPSEIGKQAPKGW